MPKETFIDSRLKRSRISFSAMGADYTDTHLDNCPLYGEVFFTEVLNGVQKDGPYQFMLHWLQLNNGAGSVSI